MSNPYKNVESSSKMLPSFVCYVDILGFSKLSEEAIKSEEGEQFLSRLLKALSEAYKCVRERAGGWLGGEDLFSIKIFTDNIVIGWPIPYYEIDRSYGEGELGQIFSIFSKFQIGLALEGFLIRGGIAFGNHYMDDDVVFGDALIEAISLDKTGGPPRLSLAPSAIQMLRRHLGFYGKIEHSPQYQDILCDFDETLFLNYLNLAFSVFPERGIFFDVIEGHKRVIVHGLEKYKENSYVRSKYEWAARYHNFICQEIFQKYQNVDPYHSEDELLDAAAQDAQSLVDYLIDFEAFVPMPKRMDNDMWVGYE